MKSEYSISSYKTSHFQYPTLDKIHGEPTIDTLLHLFKQLKINAQSVPTKLGGGQLGYLALVISTEDYNAIPNAVPFTRPIDPGVFQYISVETVQESTPSTPTSPPKRRLRTTTNEPETPAVQRKRAKAATRSSSTSSSLAIAIAQQKAVHEETTRRFHECQAVEQALRQQLIAAIEPDYLEALRDPITCMLQETIPNIKEYLLETFGHITPQELADREEEIKNFAYDPTKPVDTVFNKVTQYSELCTLCNNGKTDPQLIQLVYIIFN